MNTSANLTFFRRVAASSNKGINSDGKKRRSFVALFFAAGYAWRYAEIRPFSQHRIGAITMGEHDHLRNAQVTKEKNLQRKRTDIEGYKRSETSQVIASSKEIPEIERKEKRRTWWKLWLR
jgi:hypothetical protein